MQTNHTDFSPPLRFPLSSVPVDFGESLRRERTARGWSQARLASAAGLKRETVVRLEAGGGRRPAADTVFRLQAALHLNPGELVPAWPEWNPVGGSTMGARSRARRRMLDLSLVEVARASGVSAATLSRYERDMRWESPSLLEGGPGSPSTPAAEALARALGFADALGHAIWCSKIDET